MLDIIIIVTCSDDLIHTTIQNYIIRYQGTKKLIHWQTQGCTAFDDDYKSIANITVTVTSELLGSGSCTLMELLNHTQYLELIHCQRMY